MKEETIYNLFELRANLEWDKWIVKIPFLNFPSHWNIKIIPPYLTGIVRFLVQTDKMLADEYVSIYLDCYDIAGFVGQLYWKIYPNEAGTSERFLMDETTNLMLAIELALKKKGKNEKSNSNVLS